jgi:hypothetical protein
LILDPHGEEARSAVSNHEARKLAFRTRAFILRDAAQAPLLRMRVERTDEREMQGHQV